MITQLNSSNISTAYNNNKIGANKESTGKNGINVSSQGDKSKVQQIKDSIDSGEYKINLQALSQKIAQELL